MMAQAQKTLLVLPGGYGDALAHRDFAVSLGLSVIGASSLPDDPAAAGYAEWAVLPHISDPAFEAELAKLMEARGVDVVHAAHDAVLHRLRKVLPGLAPHVVLTHGRTWDDVEDDYRRLLKLASERPSIPELARATAPRPALSDVETAGFLRAAMAIPGQSYEDKLLALIEAARRTPEGDIVEIGSYVGRTAALFAMLSARYGLGKVLCVDPWAVEAIDQGADALREFAETMDWAGWRRLFEINVAPFANGRLNYIHGKSVDAARQYAASPTVVTETFGETRFAGEIGLLYIDGNHEYSHVLDDCRAWAPRVRPGGWIVFDDYVWAWGDGVRRVGDDFLAARAGDIGCSFVAANALFVQLRTR
jgi:hypothetical protein